MLPRELRRCSLGLLLGGEVLLSLQLLLLELLLMLIGDGLILKLLLKLSLSGEYYLSRGPTICHRVVGERSPMSVSSNTPAGTLPHLHLRRVGDGGGCRRSRSSSGSH